MSYNFSELNVNNVFFKLNQTFFQYFVYIKNNTFIHYLTYLIVSAVNCELCLILSVVFVIFFMNENDN